jgi:integrase/recombinase XerD
MSKRKKPTPPSRTAIVRRPPDAALVAPPEVLNGELVPNTGPSAEPFAVFMSSCSAGSRATMRARLQAAAGILAPGSTAERYPWPILDHVAVSHVLHQLEASKAAPSTRNLTRAALRKMAKVLFGLRLIGIEERQRIDDVDPARGKRLPSGRALDDKDFRKLFKACARDANSETHPERRAAGRRDAALLAVLFGGGLRRDEASKLDVSDVDMDAGMLHVLGKGDVEALQPVVPEVVEAVRAWLDVRGQVEGDDAAALFVTVDKFGRVGKRRLDGRAIAWMVAKRGGEAGIERLPSGHLLSPHDLRRTYDTTLLEKGEDLSTVAKAMRHASISTTAIYDRRDELVVAEAVAKLTVPVRR